MQKNSQIIYVDAPPSHVECNFSLLILEPPIKGAIRKGGKRENYQWGDLRNTASASWSRSASAVIGQVAGMHS